VIGSTYRSVPLTRHCVWTPCGLSRLSALALGLVPRTCYLGTIRRGIVLLFRIRHSLLGTQVDFDAPSGKIGYAIGLFGLCVSPLAIGHYDDVRQPATSDSSSGSLG